ncbi:hypothetical protein J2045_003363 [Peteryoungia aggregata LMG 23059]|uniref:DUF4942 domain-containing protein n=1 Tax=Peteryoungia aggregata LMG 23059 TaxID=1368425 RepID=A0ABU0GAD7_9HYPH|nr:DUF4942 domain-containing protein [Peteryoungia aggregata]MDQ0422315.1 hypothetical protein [Peteryoungia aggregata LMG 23059]
MTMNAIVTRQTVEQICAFRDQAIKQFSNAFEKIEEASDAIRQAHKLWEGAAPGKPGYYSNLNQEVESFSNAVSLPDRDIYLRTAKRLIDVTVWTHVIQHTGIENLMDKEAKDQLRSQMRYVPERRGRDGEIINQDEIDRMLPEVTPENVYATLERFQADAEMIFRRGIVNVFSKLDRRFRSHDGFKVGSRMILDYLCNSDGYFSTTSDRADRLSDVERAFRVLEGNADHAGFYGIANKIYRERRNFERARSEHENAYFKVRIFMNGNAHLWFTRKDLVERINKILAEHYGETLGDGMTKEADPLKDVKTTPAKRYGFFPTPDAAAEEVFRKLNTWQSATNDRLRILEPSAGTGQLARRAATVGNDLAEWQREKFKDHRFDHAVDCIEIQPHLAHQLEAEGIYNRVTCADFLTVKPDPSRLYDRVVMNPPFDRERDIDHVMHAFEFLKPEGQLVAIMSAGTEFRETKKSIAFRDLMEKLGAEWSDLPAGSFAESGTYCNTGILVVWKSGKPRRYGRPTWEKL